MNPEPHLLIILMVALSLVGAVLAVAGILDVVS